MHDPDDEYRRELEANVRPRDWNPPRPASRYHMVVIGAGTAGLVTAVGAASLGARVALVERGLMGGDCLNVGCVPSKALISAARAAAAVRAAGEFGIEVPEGMRVDFPQVMERVRKLRARISRHDSAARFRDLGVDVFFGHACFRDSHCVDVEGIALPFKRAVIATGSRPAVPPLPGLSNVAHLTNETVFSLTERPRRLGVIGAGPIGCELAQAFAQLGTEVVLFESEHGVLSREDREAAELVQRSMERDGVRVVCCGRDLAVSQDRREIRLTVDSHQQHHEVIVDRLLVAAGRKANVEGLGLESIGVAWGSEGIEVNDRLQTTVPHIFAAGDVCSTDRFTHVADFMARIVVQNALFRGRKRASRLTIPWCTYTSPELAHVGLQVSEASDRGVKIDTYLQPFSQVDRAVLAGDDEGFVKVHTKRGSDEILGATIVGRNAGELIGEITLAMTHGLGLSKIGSTIHPYPTAAEAIRKLGDQYARTRLTPWVRTLLHNVLRWSV